MTQEIIYTYSFNGEEYKDLELISADKAQELADLFFQEFASDWDMDNGDEREIEIIGFYYNENTGERVIVETIDSCVIYDDESGYN